MRYLRLLCFFLLTLSLSSLAQAYQLPQLGAPGYDGLTQVQEQELGVQFMNAIRKYMPLVRDPFVLQYVQQLGYRLAKHSGSSPQNFRFFVIKDGGINAFAGPGGNIGINSGLITAAHSEGELASVMAHEIAHVTQRHIARNIASMKKLQIINIAAMLAAAALGSSNAQAAQGLTAAGIAGSHQSMLNHSREHEQEADRVGMKILAKSGYRPSDMSRFFERLLQQAKLNRTSDLPEFLSTHPDTRNRIAESESLSRAYRSAKKPVKSTDFYFIQARTLVDTNSQPVQLARFLKNKLRKSKKTTLNYAYALALLKAHKASAANQQLQTLIKAQPNNTYLLTSLAQSYAAMGKEGRALSLLSKLHRTLPNNLAVTLYYAQQLLHAKQAKKAARLLKLASGSTQGNELYLTLLARAQGKAGNLGEAYLARAKLFLLFHNNRAALTQLEQGVKLCRNRYTKARLNYEIARLKREMEFNKRFR